MMANSTSWAASLETLAPTSSTVLTPRRVGQPAPIAGRSRSAETIRRISLEMAMRAPVLPAETAALASPARIASTAFHRLVPLPRRSAWAGLSSMPMTRSVWRISLAARAAGCLASSAFRAFSSPCSRNRTCRPLKRCRASATAGATTEGP